MSVRKLTASLLTALVILHGAVSLSAQEHLPLQDPFAFDPDFQWFEPVTDMDLADLKPQKRAHTGWFATYDRLNLYVSRPELEEPGISETKIDSGWGHRYELGYMLPGEDTGWMVNWTSSGVGEFFTIRQERLNRFADEDAEGIPPFGFPPIVDEANNLGFGYRFYDIHDTENVLSYDSYELNKVWRMEPYHYGGILEPMVGLRWMRVIDTNAFMNYQSTLENPPLAGPNFDEAELLTSSQAITTNDLLGGQLGFRYFKFRDRFTYSSDFRAFFGGAYQDSESFTASELTIYDGGDVSNILKNATKPNNTRNEEFFVGFDVRAEVGYQLTRLISIRGGFQLVDIARGVWRGGDGRVIARGDNDQDVVMLGGTFGINLNH
jgi:hypothetical protein